MNGIHVQMAGRNASKSYTAAGNTPDLIRPAAIHSNILLRRFKQ